MYRGLNLGPELTPSVSRRKFKIKVRFSGRKRETLNTKKQHWNLTGEDADAEFDRLMLYPQLSPELLSCAKQPLMTAKTNINNKHKNNNSNKRNPK